MFWWVGVIPETISGKAPRKMGWRRTVLRNRFPNIYGYGWQNHRLQVHRFSGVRGDKMRQVIRKAFTMVFKPWGSKVVPIDAFGAKTHIWKKKGSKTHKLKNRGFVKLAVPTPSIAPPPFEQPFSVILGPVANGCAISAGSAGWQVQFLICSFDSALQGF